ncbi:DUF4956 domain-containing protein [Cellulosimicrobium marinum]|uniref:DUF4956 domain-containing protein n=1 Tax=Cellulosimicrobium marinum TaxID=1638992 RepID=UPI001E2DECC0|nr:DUF4956 domain-containing protein [Cellulosimicrobium marinum]MCB7136190.1 DUF4956 domain-containing protein [Cellulosimicrobium marinum]
MSQPLLYAVDLVAAVVLAFGLYYPRHRRRDLVVAYLGVNVGVLAVAATLASSAVGAGLGLGLFGVLSIIRLRSSELSQTEVAYYFASLALGLLGGLGASTGWLSLAGTVLVLVVMGVVDHPRVLRRSRTQTMVLDRAFVDEVALVAHLESLLGARVHGANVQRVDLVNDTTWVEVRYAAPGTGPRSTAQAVTAAEGPASAASLPGPAARASGTVPDAAPTAGVPDVARAGARA